MNLQRRKTLKAGGGLGILGLFMAAAARDSGILGFGLGLALFGVLFCWWMIKTAYDDAEDSGQA